MVALNLSINDSEAQIDSKLSLIYDLLVPITKNRVLATHNNEISLIDEHGILLTTYDLIYIPSYIGNIDNDGVGSYYYVDNYLIAVKGPHKGIIDYDGDVLVEVKYRDIRFNSPNTFEVLE